MEYRFATEKDTALILQFIKELASYEKMLSEVVADEATLKEWTVYRIAGDTLKTLGSEK